MRSGLEGRSIAIYRELNGFRGAVIVTCYKMAGRPEATASYCPTRLSLTFYRDTLEAHLANLFC